MLLPILTWIGTALRAHLEFGAVLPLYLLVVVVTSLVDGFYPALSAALAASLLLNYYFVPPLHTLTVDRASNIVALIVFLLIAVLVSRVVDLAAHRTLLAESDRQRTALLNAVSHDLRTPLAAAKAAVSSVRSAEVPWSAAERGELLTTAEDALDRLSALVTNLLDLSRLQAGALAVLPAVVGLDDVVARTLEYADPHVRIAVDVPPDLPEVVADVGLLERAVANVLENALRYAPPETKVQIVGRRAAGAVELLIIDHGPGIDPAQVDAVFRPFQRNDDVPTAGAGVGLGLAIARGFTEAMGGRVRTRRTEGGGTTVVLSLRPAQ
ncbi:MAG: two-component system, OmpR family, sensor histidine kinase KdpD [Pseudonocardiales bacterium]|nr:two-component system, OmpR family, sensor histidine kinase KdpD [Pseudonocardiales bacterium]